MANQNYLKCPGSDPVSKAVPELFSCLECNTGIEIWTDEVGGKCSSCNIYFKKVELANTSDTVPRGLSDEDIKIEKLIMEARNSCASDIMIVSSKDISAEENLADKCREPRCENYGMSKSCPPHVSGPLFFRELLEKFSKGIFFKIDIPSKIMFSNERLEFFRLLHETAAGIEQSAVKMGFLNAQAYAGGPCKKIFCHDHLECLAISGKGKCRNPQFARPSMSGFGVNVAKLFEVAGWKMTWTSNDTDSTIIKMTNVCGLILIH